MESEQTQKPGAAKDEPQMRALSENEMDQEVAEQFVGNFVPKDLFINQEVALTATKVSLNRWGRYTLLVQGYETHGQYKTLKEEGNLTLSAHNINELRDLAGAKPKDWLNKPFLVVGEKFDARTSRASRKGDQINDGTIIHFKAFPETS